MHGTPCMVTRKPWAAGLLSGLMPGLGQLYNGQPAKAFLLAVFAFFISGLLGTGLIVYVPLYFPYIMALSALLGLAVLVAIIRDAMRTARQQGTRYALKFYNKWYAYLSFAIFCVFVLQPFESDLMRYMIQGFRIPGGSMAPTLVVGDHVFIDKSLSWTETVFQRGDIVVFKFPEDESKDFIKRIIGLPGETIQIRNKTVYINNQPLDDTAYTQRIDPGIIDGAINPRDNFGPVTIPEEAYFVMGDNRDQSLDSRFWGCVQRSKIMGKLRGVYWSWDTENSNIRWDRVGQTW